MKPTALIYGADGFDADVSRNIAALYRDLGMDAYLGRSLRAASVLCIERTPKTATPIPQSYAKVHVFDYVCADNLDFLAKLEARPGLLVFFPTEARRSIVLEAAPQLEPYARVALPPVKTSLWPANGGSPGEFGNVHIGHFKPSYTGDTDAPSAHFLEALTACEARVWGNGWDRTDIPRQLQMGRLGLRSVSYIYAHSQLALGMMYPYQRGMTVSGRMWHAPLNGCPLFTESTPSGTDFPGVELVDYGQWIDAGCPGTGVDRSTLRDQARAFWDQKYRHWVATLETALEDGKNWGAMPSTARRLRERLSDLPIDLTQRAKFALGR